MQQAEATAGPRGTGRLRRGQRKENSASRTLQRDNHPGGAQRSNGNDGSNAMSRGRGRSRGRRRGSNTRAAAGPSLSQLDENLPAGASQQQRQDHSGDYQQQHQHQQQQSRRQKQSDQQMKAASNPPLAPHERTGTSSSMAPTVAGSSSVASVDAVKSGNAKDILSNTSFQTMNLSAPTKRALQQILKFEMMTKVQEATLPIALTGVDLLAKAKTGTGKTVGFLLPIVERIATSMAASAGDHQDQRKKSLDFNALVIAPTRDLAFQVQKECEQLCTFHSKINVQSVVGGVNKNHDLNKLRSQVDILISTPGRLIDHLTTTEGFADRFANLQTLVLDEADRLLDMGFKRDLQRIFSFLPTQRQTMLFSATYPSSLQDITSLALKKGFEVVDTVGEESEQTNAQVVQDAVVVPLEQQIDTLYWMLTQHQEQHGDSAIGYKVIVFFPTARIVAFMSKLFNIAGKHVLEMHSRKTQAQRDKVVQEFRSKRNLVMFSSDVTSRGLDFENVTLVVQIGMSDREQYIHRLGRTARKGTVGQGVLVLAPTEVNFLNVLRDLPITKQEINPWISRGPAPNVSNALAQMPANPDLLQAATRAYITFLGFYINKAPVLRVKRSDLIQMANHYSRVIGFDTLPEIEAKTASKMGFKFDSTEINIKQSNRRRVDRSRQSTAQQPASSGTSSTEATHSGAIRGGGGKRSYNN